MKVHKSPDRSPYLQNRAPLKEKPYLELPFGAIRPAGWLRQRLVELKKGLEGGSEGDGDQPGRLYDWIGVLVPLAYMLEDESLKATVNSWCEWLVARERWDRWPDATVSRFLEQYYTVSSDSRILSLMLGCALYQRDAFAGATGNGNQELIYWLYNVTGEAFLLELAALEGGQAGVNAAGELGMIDELEKMVDGALSPVKSDGDSHTGWAAFAQHLWHSTAEGGLAVLLFGPCTVKARVAGGIEVEFREETEYPFGDNVRFIYSAARDVSFSLHVRIPGSWVGASIRVNGRMWTEAKGKQMVLVFRKWRMGDVMEMLRYS